MTESDYLNAVELLRVAEYELREYIAREQSKMRTKSTSGAQFGELDNAHCSLVEVLRLLEIPQERADEDDEELEDAAGFLSWVEEKSWEGRE